MHYSGVFLQSWPLFLTDTMPAEAHVESQCQEIIRSVMGGSAASSTPRIVSSTPRIVTSSTRTPSAQSLAPAPAAAKGGLTNKTPSVKLTSPILGTMLHSATVAVRAAAVGALVKVLSGLQLRTYFATTRPGAIGRIDTRSSSTSRVTSAGSALFSPGGGVSGSSGVRGLIGQGNKEASAISKQLKTLFKIIQVVIVMLQTEPRDEVLELLLKLASLLLNHMPLSDYWKNRKVVRTGGIIMSNDANSVYERYAVVMYHLILKIALRYELPSLAASFPTEQAAATGGDSATTSRAVPVSVTASYMAMCWVTERCKQLDQSQAFTLALQMTYLPVARPTGVAGDGVGAGPPPGIATAAGMLRSGVVGGVAGVGGGGSGGGQSFIHAAVHCLLRAFPPHVTNNLYCITVRTLCSALAQYHPALFLSDPRWLCSLLNKLESHSLPALRLQGSKMLASLFEHDLKNKLAQLGTASAAESKLYGFLPPQGDYLTDDEMLNNSCFATTYEACEVVGRSLKANVAAMLGACTDDAHIVRTQAMLALTSLGAYTWRVLHNIASSPKQLALIASSFPAFGASFLPEIISMRVVLMRVLLIGTADVIGTVRASAFKSIGDCVVHNALLLSVTPRPGRNVRRDGSTASTHPLLTSIEECYMEDLFRALAVGIVDTKLAVRIQAAWALGNVLINLLPYRWEHLSRTVDCVPSSLAPTSSHSWLSDACWLSLYRDLLPLLRDSDKVLATAVCCIGSVIAGMRPEYAQSHRECLVNLHTSLIQEFLVPEFGLLLDGESEGAFNWRVFSNIKTPISEQSQKLSFALSQSLGFILHSFVHSWEDNAGGAPLPQARYVRDIMEVQIHFLKYSKLKVQLQAVQTLVYAAAKHNALDVLSCDYSGQLVR